MTESWERAALACFDPPLPPESVEAVIQELRGIIATLSSLVGSDRFILLPVRKIGESDTEYENRAKALLSGPKKKGRPKEIGAGMLIHSLRELLTKHGCLAGVSKAGWSNEIPRRSYLVELAIIIHDAAGGPFGRGLNWRTLAARAIKPLWIWETALGLDTKGMTAEGKRDFNSMLREAETKPLPRKRSKTRMGDF